MHLHGHNFQVLHEGNGLTWDGTIVNPSNPIRRDVELIRPGGHLVLQFEGNPGMFDSFFLIFPQKVLLTNPAKQVSGASTATLHGMLRAVSSRRLSWMRNKSQNSASQTRYSRPAETGPPGPLGTS
jgi:Multicopper oxidase